ncbi:hypothetical protein KSP40_PGU006298 [Platanthera guangdongensis]|uniref:Uncharacterized protein n=1 Tax=Platanthera guangdongensis TaxID=2320717 RepID=A0ABR2N1T4_9ASPA
MENFDHVMNLANQKVEVEHQVAVGGADGILNPLEDRLSDLHKAIASLAALPKTDESGGDHILENFHSSRTIRKLVLDSPAFAEILWKTVLEGKSEIWAQGHSCKVVSAFLESPEARVKNLAERELQPLVDSGVLKLSGKKELSLGKKEEKMIKEDMDQILHARARWGWLVEVVFFDEMVMDSKPVDNQIYLYLQKFQSDWKRSLVAVFLGLLTCSELKNPN